MTALSFFLAFVGFAFLIIAHEAGHFAAAKAVGMRVERFALFFPPLLVKKTIGETEYGIGAIPLGGYVRISGMNPAEDLPDEVRTRAYYAQPVWKRVVVIAAGPLVNLVLAFVLLLVFFWIVGPVSSSNRVDEVRPGMPAAGKIAPGERIVGLDGQPATPTFISNEIAIDTCGTVPPVAGCAGASPMTFTIEGSDGSTRQVEVTPVYDAKAKRMRVGFLWGERIPLALGPAIAITGDRLLRIGVKAATLPATLLDPVERSKIHGVVGSYEVTRQTILHDPADVVGILAVISLSLAVINMFPFLPLDGGHIFWAIVEKIRRKPVSYATMERAGVIGILLLIPLFLIGFTNDVNTLLGPGFGPPQ